jgi:hypothetical protein
MSQPNLPTIPQTNVELLGPTQQRFLERVVANPENAGMLSDPEQMLRWQVAARYVMEYDRAARLTTAFEGYNVMNAWKAPSLDLNALEQNTHEARVTRRYARLATQNQQPQADPKDFNALMAADAARSVRTDLENNREREILGLAVGRVLDMANLISTEQATWEVEHGTFVPLDITGGLEGPEIIQTLFAVLRRTFRRNGWLPMNPQGLLEEMHLDELLDGGGFVISEMVAAGVIERDAANNTLRPTVWLRRPPLLPYMRSQLTILLRELRESVK